MKARKAVGFGIALALVALGATTSPGVTNDWSGASSVNMSGTAANWGGTSPGTSDIGRWNAATYANPPTVNAVMTIGGLLFDTGNTAGVTLSGANALTVNGTGIQLNKGSGAVTINAPLTLGAAQSWTQNSDTLLTLGGNVVNSTFLLTLAGYGAGGITINGALGSGSGGLTVNKAGGIVTLAGANNYTGASTISFGLLKVTGSTAAGSTVAVNAGGALGGTGTVGGAVTAAVGTSASTGALGGQVRLTDGAVGTLNLGSTLTLNGTGAGFHTPNNLYFDLGNGAGGADKIITTGAHSAPNAGGAIVNLNQLSGGTINAGTYTLIQGGAASTFTGYSLGTTRAGRNLYSGFGASGNNLQVTIGAGTAGDANPFCYWKGSTAVWNTQQWYQDSGGTVTCNPPGYSSNVRFAATGAANLSNALGQDYEINSLTVDAGVGATIISNSVLTIDATADNGNTAGNGITVNNVAGTSIGCKVGLASSQTWTVGAGATLTVTNIITDYGGGYSLTKAGTGTLYLWPGGLGNAGGPNYFTGGFTLSAGTVKLNSAGYNGVGTGPFTIQGGTTIDVAGNNIQTLNNSQYNLNGSFTASSSGANTLNFSTGGVTLGGSITVTVGIGTFNLNNSSQTITDGGAGYGITKDGANVLQLSGSTSTFSGKAVILNGTLAAGTIANVGLPSGLGQPTTVANGTIDVYGSGTLKVNANSTSDRVINLTGAGGTPSIYMAVNGNTLTLNSALTSVGGTGTKTLTIKSGDASTGDNNSVVLNGVIPNVGDGSLLGLAAVFGNQSGQPSTVTLGGVNTFTGPISLTQVKTSGTGTLVIGGSGQLGGGAYTSTISIGSLCVLKYSSSAVQALSGVISGPGALTMNGSGTLSLSAANTFSGSTTNTSGTLTLNNNLALQNSLLNTSSGAITLGSGITTPTIGGLMGSTAMGTAIAGGGYSTVTALTLNPQFGVIATNSAGIADGAAGMTLTITGSGIQVLYNGSTYTGATTINGGTLQLGTGTAGQNGTLSSASIVDNAVLAFNDADNQTFSSNISGSGMLTKTGAGTLTLSGSNSYTGPTVVNGGVLQYGAAGALAGSGRNILVNAGGAIAFGSIAPATLLARISTNSMGAVALTGAETVDLSAFPTLSLGASGSITYTGTLTPYGTTYYLGGGGGTLTLNAATTGGNNLVLFGNGNAGTVDLNGSSRTFGTVTVGGGTTLNGTLTATSFNVQSGTISAVLAGIGASLIKTGTGTVTLNGSAVNTYTGSTTVNAGMLALDFSYLNPATDLINGGSALILGGGTLNIIGRNGATTAQTFSGLTLNTGHSTITNTQNSATAINVTLGGITRPAAGATIGINLPTAGYNNTTAVNVNGILGPWATVGAGTLTKYAVGGGNISALSGTAAATAANVTDTTGAFNYDVAAVGTLGGSANFNTLRYTGAAGTIAGAFTANGLMNAGTGNLIFSGNATIGSTRELVVNAVGSANNDITFSGTVANNGGGASTLVKTGLGKLTLAVSDSYTGGTVLNAGTLELGHANALNTGTLTINGGILGATTGINPLTGNNPININGNFTYGTGNQAFNCGSGAVTLGGSYTITVSQNTMTLGGKISDGGNAYGLTKAGTQILTLSSTTSDYTGKTIVQAGTLVAGQPLTNAGVAGPLGAPTGANAVVDIYNGATLAVTAGSSTTDRTINLAGTGAGTGSLKFNSNEGQYLLGAVTATGVGSKTLAVATGYSSNGDREEVTFNGTIADGSDGSPLSLQVTFGTQSGSSASVNLVAGGTFTGPISMVRGSAVLWGYLVIGGRLARVTGSNNTFVNTPGSGQLNGGNFAAPISIDTNTIFYYNSSANQILSGIISGTGAIMLNGSGTLTLTGANTYTGGTTLNTGSGTLVIGGAGSLGNGVYAVGITNNSTFKYSSTAAQTLSGVISGTGALVKTNAATLTLTGVNTFSGPITVNANGGTLEIGGAGQLGSGTYSAAISIGSGATFKYNSSATQTLQTGDISGDGTLTKSGTGTLTLAGAKTYGGPTTIQAGTLALASASSINNSATISVAAGATFDVSALGASATYSLTSSNSLVASGTGTGVGTTAAVIRGGFSGVVSLGARPVTLNLASGLTPNDTTHPALLISQGALSLSGTPFTVNASAPLADGAYRIVQVGDGSSGTINESGSYPFASGTAIGAGKVGVISVSSGNVVLTVAPTYTVTYDDNGSTGGAVPTDGSAYTNGATVTVLANTGSVEKTSYAFGGWNTQADGNGATYPATGSATFTMGSSNVTLYAKWTLAVTQPSAYKVEVSGSGSASMAAGDSVNLTISALDGTGSVLSSLNSGMILSLYGLSSSPFGSAPTVTDMNGAQQAVTPGAVTPGTQISFVNGVANVSGANNGVLQAFNAPGGAVTLHCTDGTASSASGTGAAGLSLTVTPLATSALAVEGFPNPATAGVAGNVTVRASDVYGNTSLGYAGTVAFTAGVADEGKTLPGNYTFVGGDNGAHTFVNGVTLTLAVADGGQSLMATDTLTPSITGMQTGITVNAAAASMLAVTNFPTTVGIGKAYSMTVIAQDAYSNTATGYTGTVTFSVGVPDSGKTLPGNYTFVTDDNCAHTFTNGVILTTEVAAGGQSLTATDTLLSSITGTKTNITVVPPVAFNWTNSAGLWSTNANWTNEYTVAAPLAGGDRRYGLTFSKPGTYIATNDFSDGFLFNQLTFSGPTLFLVGGSLTFTNNGASLPQINQVSNVAVTVSNNISLATNVAVGGSGTGQLTLTGVLSGEGGLSKSGSFVLYLNPGGYGVVGPGFSGIKSLFTGAATLSDGKIQMNSQAQNSLGTGPLTISGGTLAVGGNNIQTLNNSAYYLNGDFTVDSSGGNTLNFSTGNATLGNNIKVTVTNTSNTLAFNINGNLGDGGNAYGLTKDGPGPMNLVSAANSYAGKTVVMRGTLQYGTLANIGAGNSSLGAPTTLANGTIDLHNGVTLLKIGGQPSCGTDRPFNLAGTGAGTVTISLNNNGTWLTNTAPVQVTGTGAKTLVVNPIGDASGIVLGGAIPDASDSSPLSLQATIAPGGGGNYGSVTLSGVSTFSGPLSVSGGSVTVNGRLIIGGSGQLGAGNYTNAISLAANTVFNYASSAAQILSGAISGAGAVTKSGTGTLTLAGANGYTGATLVGAGKLLLGSGGSIGTSTVTVSNSATLGCAATSGAVTIGAPVTLNSGANVTFAADGNAGTIGKISVSGNINLNANTITVNVSGAQLAAGTYTLMECTSGALSNSGANPGVTMTGAGAAGGASIVLDGTTVKLLIAKLATEVRIETRADGSGTVVPAQELMRGRTLTVYAVSRDSDGLFVTNVAADSWALVSKSGGVVDGDLVPAGDSKSATFTANLLGSAVLHAVAGALTPTDSGSITVVDVDADGTWNTLVNNSVWNTAGNWVSNGIALGTNRTAWFDKLNLTASTTARLDIPVTIGSIIFGDTVSGGGGWTLDNNGNAANVLTLAVSSGAPTISVSNTLSGGATVSAVIAGTSGLTKAGGGVLVLSATNTYTGRTTVSAGTLQLAQPFSNAGVAGMLGAATGADATIDICNGATLYCNWGGTSGSTDRGLNLVSVGSGTATLQANGNEPIITFNGAITATGSGAKTFAIVAGLGGGGGGDRLEVTFNSSIPDVSDGSPLSLNVRFNTQSGASSSVNLYSGGTFTGPITTVKAGGLNSGYLVIGGRLDRISFSNNSFINTPGSGQLNGGNYAGNIALDTSTVLYYDSTANQILSGAISGNGALTKDASGTLTLSGANSYTGATTVVSGTFRLAGGSLGNTAIAFSGSSSMAVQPGSATAISAGMTGAGTGGATVNLGARTFDMTDGAVSTFNLQQQDSFAGSAFTIGNGATLKFNAGATGADRLAVTKAASVSGTINVVIDTTGATALADGTYSLVTASSGLSGGTWQFSGGGTVKSVKLGFKGYTLTLTASDTAVQLQVSGWGSMIRFQ